MIWDRYGYPGFKDYSVIRAYFGFFSWFLGLWEVGGLCTFKFSTCLTWSSAGQLVGRLLQPESCSSNVPFQKGYCDLLPK